MNNFLKVLRACCLCVLSCHLSIAQEAKAAAASGNAGERLQMVIILSRHGVRSPTWTDARLNSYSALPWPKWSVPPGNLTSRGYELVRLFGNFDRMSLARTGIMTAHGCADATKTYVWADTDQRTMESARALAQGFFPECPPPVHGLAVDEDDPLFHLNGNGTKLPDIQPLIAQLQAKVQEQSTAQQRELLAGMQHVLLGCAAEVLCAPAHAPLLPFDAPVTIVKGREDHIVDVKGQLAQAASFAEDFLLEYADGMPMEQVGWGKVDEPRIKKFLALHSDYFNLMYRTPQLARLNASNLLDHILLTLDQAVTGQPVAGAIGKPGDKVVILMGHDTNLAAVASLLNLTWIADGRTNDTPPGAELRFLLFRDQHGRFRIQLNYAVQTLRQMREITPLNLRNPPVQVQLVLPSCFSTNGLCSWEKFSSGAASAIDPAWVVSSSY